MPTGLGNWPWLTDNRERAGYSCTMALHARFPLLAARRFCLWVISSPMSCCVSGERGDNQGACPLPMEANELSPSLP